MISLQQQELDKFIKGNLIERVDGSFLFDAKVKFKQQDVDETIQSQVLLLLLPHSIAVYIFEFFNEAYHRSEMYSTPIYSFACSTANILQITKPDADCNWLISLAHVPFSGNKLPV